MESKILGFTIITRFIKTRIKKIHKYEDTRYIAQMLIEMTTTFWKFKRVSQKVNNVERFLEGLIWNTRIQDGFPYKHEAEEAIKREIEKMEFIESTNYLKVSNG